MDKIEIGNDQQELILDNFSIQDDNKNSNNSNIQQQLIEAQLQIAQLKEQNHKLAMEINDLKSSLKIEEEKNFLYELTIQKLKSTSKDQECNCGCHQMKNSLPVNKNLQISKKRFKNFEDQQSLRKDILRKNARHNTAHYKSPHKQEIKILSPFSFHQHYDAEQEIQENGKENNEENALERQLTNKLIRQPNKLNTYNVESTQIKLEKTEQIVALGYDCLKDGTLQIKPKSQFIRFQEKRFSKINNNSSKDASFKIKMDKIEAYKHKQESKQQLSFSPKIILQNSSSNINDKTNSNNIKNLKTPEIKSTKNSNFSISPNVFMTRSRNQTLEPAYFFQNLNCIQLDQSQQVNTSNSLHSIFQSQSNKSSLSLNDLDGSCSLDLNIKAIIENQKYDPEIIKYESECQNYKNLYDNIMKYGQIGDLLFEEFMLIGPDLKELAALVEQQKNPFQGVKASTQYIKGKVQQTTLFSKPCYVSPFVCQKRQTLAQFAFPKGLQYYRYRSQADLSNLPPRLQDILLMDLCQQHNSGKSNKTFVLNLRGEECDMNYRNSMQSINSNSIMYAVCFQQEDILVVPDEAGEQTIFVFPIVYCFLTYYPFVDYFLQILYEIVNRVKTIRLVKSSFSGLIDNNLKNADIQNVLQSLQQDRELCLSLKALQIKDVDPDKVISFNLNPPKSYLLEIEQQGNDKDNNSKKESTFKKISQASNSQSATISYLVPPIEEMGYIEGLEAAYLTFSNLPYYDFQFILTLIMLEKKVVFLSKNVTLLTLTSLTFQNLLKPFKYPHPVIFSMSEDLIYFLEAPVPIVVGFNFSAEKFEFEFGFNNECYYVDLDQNMIISKNEQSLQKIEQLKYNFASYKEKIKEIFKEINNDITSKQFGNKFKKLIQITNNEKKLVFNPDSKQINNLKTLLQLIRKSFQDSIILKLPNNPIIQVENESQLDMGEIQKQVLKNNCEHHFLQSFVETQIFSYFMEQRYI